jgi:hypothetical protein
LLFSYFFKKTIAKTKKYYICGGEMAEWSNAAVLKTVDLFPRVRGFESLFLRIPNHSRSVLRDFCFQAVTPGSPERHRLKTKTGMSSAHAGVIWDAGISPRDHRRAQRGGNPCPHDEPPVVMVRDLKGVNILLYYHIIL